jgi:hypothetical protein
MTMHLPRLGLHLPHNDRNTLRQELIQLRGQLADKDQRITELTTAFGDRDGIGSARGWFGRLREAWSQYRGLSQQLRPGATGGPTMQATAPTVSRLAAVADRQRPFLLGAAQRTRSDSFPNVVSGLSI